MSQASPFTQTHSPLKNRRADRATRIGMPVSAIILAVASIGIILDLHWGRKLMALNDALLMIGAFLSILITRLRQRNRFAWVPLYASVWLGTFPILGSTGGYESPLFIAYLIMLFIGGVILQTRFRPNQVAVFVIGNFALWAGLTETFHLFPAPPTPANVVLIQNFLFLIASIAVFLSIFSAEAKMVAEAKEQKRKLERFQHQLSHAAKMAEIGTLVSSTAHELAQPLQIITLSGSFLKRQSQQSNINPELLATFSQNIVDASSRLGAILTTLKDLTRKEPLRFESFDLREAVGRIADLTRLDLRNRGIEFTLEMPESPVEYKGDTMKIQQVLLNLINNARDAAAQAQEPLVKVSLNDDRDWARIRVSNNGPAIPLDAQSKVFETYFTTKKRGEGTGLGLTVCSEIVALHHGRILFSSEDNNTNFVVDLPKPGQPGLKTEFQEVEKPIELKRGRR